jgi:hypothetical protein
MSNKIQWPKNPISGQVYTSPNGDYFVFDGCAWLHTCCPFSSCNIREGESLIVAITLPDEAPYGITSPVTFLVPFTYQGSDSWKFEVIADANGVVFNLTITQSYGQWELNVTSDLFQTTLAVISGSDPLGNWEITDLDSGSKVFSYCGQVDTICLKFISDPYSQTNVRSSLSPFVLGDDPSSTIFGYSNLIGIFIIWDSIDNQWVLFTNLGPGGFIEVAYLPGVPQTSLPIGSGWVETEDPNTTIITESGLCPCDKFIDGVTLYVNGLNDEEETFAQTIYFRRTSEFIWESPQFYSVYIEFDGSVYRLYETVPSLTELAYSTDLETWVIVSSYSGSIYFESVEGFCGSPIGSAGCFSFDRSGETYRISMIPVQIGEDNYFISEPDEYNSFFMFYDGTEWVINVDSAVWGSEIIATAGGDASTPPYDLVFVPANISYTNVTFTEGLCLPGDELPVP